MAGPRTPPSDFYNPDPVDVVEDAALAPTPVADAPGLTPALASTGQEMRTGQPRARYGGRMNADGGLAWDAQNSQMMPGGTQIQESRTAWNDPLFGNTGQVLPHAHWANALQGRQQERAKQRAELKKKLEGWDPMGGIPEVAPAYQEDLNKYVADGWSKIYQSALDLNGGNEEQTQLALMNPNSPEGRAMKAWVDDATVVARKANFVTNDAIATMKAMDEDPDAYDAKVYNAADSTVRAMENGGDVRAMANSLEQFQVIKGWNAYLKESGIGAALQAAKFGTDVLVPGKRDKNGRIVYDKLTIADPGAKERIIDAYLSRVAPGERKRIGDDEIRRQFDAILTMDEKADRSSYEPWHGWSPDQMNSGSGAGGNTAPFTVGVSNVQTKPAGTAGGFTKGPTMSDRLVVDIFDVTGDKTLPMAKRPFKVDGIDKDLYAPQLQFDDKAGEWVVTGRDLSQTEVDEMKKKVGDLEDDGAVLNYILNNEVGVIRSAPASNNTSKLEGYTGYRDPNEMIVIKLREKGYADANAAMVAKALANDKARANLLNELK